MATLSGENAFRVYDEEGNPLEQYDLSKGRLRPGTMTVHHERVETVEEQGHLEETASYPNGGKDFKWVVDVPGVQGRDAWDEEIDILVYVPYTEEELRALTAMTNKPKEDEERINDIEDALVELADMIAGGVQEW